MAKFKKLSQSHEGKVIYSDSIVDGIVYLAVSEIPDVELVSKEKNSLGKNSSIKVKIERELVYVEVSVKISYTLSVSDTAFKIQEAIRHNIEAMTHYRVESVNVNILDVILDDVNAINHGVQVEQKDNNDSKNVTKEG